LRALSLDGEQRVDDAGLAAVAALPELRELELYSARISNAALLDFCRRPGVQRLRLLDLCCCVGVGDLGVARGVVLLRALEELNLSQTAVTDVSVVAVLQALPRLASLNVSHTDITQAAVNAARAHGALKRLAVHGCLLDTLPQPRTSVTPAAAVAPVLRLVGP
jgi:hypothetical protein